VCRKVAHLKEGEVRHRSGSFLCVRTTSISCVQAARRYYSLDLVVEARAGVSHEPRETTGDENGQCVRGPGGGSTGAGAERELGFDPQSKAELAQGEYKGAREVLARHAHTAQPWGGPGGC
jgi:hypothetical protein